LITDFAPARDRIAFSDAGFQLGLAGAGAQPKPLPAALFTANATGSFTDASERFAYDTSTGALYYDAHGDKLGSSRLLIVTLKGDPHLAASNLFFVS
jgi:Ca2+-binding RTX toxin-like protein